MKKLLLLLIILLSSAFSWANNNSNDSLSLLEKQLSGDYYPYFPISEEVFNQLPFKVKIRPTITDMHSIGGDIKSTFFLSMQNEIYTTMDISGFTQKDSVEYLLEDFFHFIVDGTELRWNEFFLTGYGINKNEVFYRHSVSGTFPFKWTLRDYPFDTQKLSVEYHTRMDTSIVQFEFHEEWPWVNDLTLLAEGFTVDSSSITEDIALYGANEIESFADGERAETMQSQIITIHLSRNGSFLYFKLFFGAILSFIISLLAFFISKAEFESRITLCIGSIFGAIGNKYFVESSMPDVQVLTKADMINNTLIVLVIVNIFIIIAQSSKTLNLGILETRSNAIIFLISIFILSQIFIVFI